MRRWIKPIVMLSLLFGAIKFASGQTKPEVLGSPDAFIYDMKLIEEKQFLIANLGNTIQLWNYQTKSLVHSWRSSQILAIDYINNKLAGVSKSGDIVIWSIPDGKEGLQKNISDGPLTCVAWIDSVFLAVGSENGDVMKVNSITGDIVSRMSNRGAITALTKGQDNNLVTGNAIGVISVYDARDMRLHYTTKGHKTWIRGIKFSDNGQYFLTVSDDGHYRKWKSGTEIVSIENRSLGDWILCGDFTNSPGQKFDIKAFGKRNGRVIINAGFGDYTLVLNSLINCIGIIRSELPSLVLALGTHGEGIQLLNAKAMKLKSK